MFKVGNIIDYGFFKDLEVIGIDDLHYLLKSKSGSTKKIYRELVDKYGELKNLDS